MLFLFLLSGCNKDSSDLLIEDAKGKIEGLNKIEKEIAVQFIESQYGGYKANDLDTRACAFDFHPIVEEGDTVMYLLCHKEGWQLYGNTKIRPTLIFSSDEPLSEFSFSKLPSQLQSIIEDCAKYKLA